MLITIAFEGDSDRDIVLRLAADTPLLHVREQLVERTGMRPADRFRVGNANLDPGIEADTRVEELIGDDRVLRVRPARAAPVEAPAPAPEPAPEPKPEPAPAPKPAEPRPVPTPAVPTATPAEAVWGLRNDADAPDLLAQLQVALAPFTVTTPDEFTALPLDAVRALFTARRLDRGLRFGADPAAVEFGARSTQSPVVYRHPQRRPHSGGVAFSVRWTTSATASRVLHELHTRSIHNANASGGLNGFGLAANFRRDLERLQRNEVTSIHLIDEMIVPKVMLALEPDIDLEVAPELIAAVDDALAARRRRDQYEALHERVFTAFGYFFPCESLLGGTRMRTLSVVAEDLQDQEQLLSGFGFGAAAKEVPTSYGPASGEVGYAHSDTSLRRNRHIQQLREQDVRATGGNPALSLSDENAARWVASLDAVAQWDTIGHRRLVPILRFLPQRQRDQCVSVIEEFANARATAQHTVLDMAAYVIPLNRSLLDDIM
ncbi:hypothetical protein A7A76_10135 [Lysobacter enzymogenes]|uniref:hypothetical protein n=1 Tax=Lysobacter enzymogenes TaxID=69 RepID=UPI0019CF55F6|nr:hypothetical protein [Lysobacter enzymogenes]MBN7135119.1 hypothetical protein [Lysobacter enzymogenes]